MRRLAWFAGGFGSACLLCCFTAWGRPALLAAVLLCAAALAICLAARPRGYESRDASLLPRCRRRAFQISRRLAALCLGAVGAFLWFSAYTALFCAPAEELAGTEQTVSGTVSTYPRETSIGGWSVTLRLNGGFAAPDVLVYGGGDWGELKPGDRVTCTARLKSATRLYGDETTYYTARGIYLLGYCNDPPQVEKADSIPLRYWATLCAKKLREGIYAAFDDTAAPLAAAVTLGDKTGLGEQLHAALNRAGLMHAAVVSGMHISFLVSLLLFLCRGRRGVALCMVPLLFFYALMAGGTPSAFRAVIMQAVLLAGPVLRRENDGPTSLGLALLVLLIQNPYAAASISLQLSFASVAGIMLVSRPICQGILRPVNVRLKGDRPGRRLARGICRFAAASISVSLGAMLFTTPLIDLYFGQIILVSPLTGILTLWAVSVLMVSALAVGTVAIFLPAIMRPLGLLFGLTGHYIKGVVTVIGAWPLSSLDGTNPYFLLWLICAFALVVILALSPRKGRQALISLGCLAVLLGLAMGANRISAARADLTVTALDVGQGASTLLISGEGAVLVDCGGNGSSSAGDTAADRLAAMGMTELDALVLTHLDDDHFNGVAQLLYRLEVKAVYAPALSEESAALESLGAMAADEGARLILVDETLTLSVGNAALTLYPPLGAGTSNEEGLFALCSYGEFDALITGDADSFVEEMLVKYCPIPDLELLLVGHHGSAGSTGEGLLDALRPELAVISVGYNTYGHPAQAVLDRLSGAGAAVYRTDTEGSVTVTLRGGRVSVN